MKIKSYKVYYSNHAYAKVRAYSTKGAREQAWKMLGGHKYGWTKSDFMKHSTIETIN